MYLNVPPPRSEWESTLRKIGWLVLALLAPGSLYRVVCVPCIALDGLIEKPNSHRLTLNNTS